MGLVIDHSLMITTVVPCALPHGGKRLCFFLLRPKSLSCHRLLSFSCCTPSVSSPLGCIFRVDAGSDHLSSLSPSVPLSTPLSLLIWTLWPLSWAACFCRDPHTLSSTPTSLQVKQTLTLPTQNQWLPTPCGSKDKASRALPHCLPFPVSAVALLLLPKP